MKSLQQINGIVESAASGGQNGKFAVATDLAIKALQVRGRELGGRWNTQKESALQTWQVDLPDGRTISLEGWHGDARWGGPRLLHTLSMVPDSKASMADLWANPMDWRKSAPFTDEDVAQYVRAVGQLVEIIRAFE